MSEKKYFVLQTERRHRKYLQATTWSGTGCNSWTHRHPPMRAQDQEAHVFTGSIAMVDKPANDDWLPDKIKKANVKKVGVEHLEDYQHC